MTFIIPFNEKTVYNNTKLPIELIKLTFSFEEVCSYIITKGHNCINIHNFGSHRIIRTIELPNLQHISVSNCYKYIVGSNNSRIHIWKFEDASLIQIIDVDNIPDIPEEEMGYYRLSNSGEPLHTFIKNELLIASGNKVKSYILQNDIWIESSTYSLPNEDSIIVCITANPSNDYFAVGTLYGDVYIFDSVNNSLVHNFTTREILMRSDHAPAITSIAFNQDIIVVSSVGRNNILLNLSTMNSIKIEEPDRQFNGSYFCIKNYMITPCLTKFIGTINQRTYIWDATTGRVMRKIGISVDNDCSLSTKGTYLVSNNIYNGGLKVYKYKPL